MQHPEPKPEFTPRVLISHCLRAASMVTGVRRDLIASDSRQSDTILARQLGMAVAVALAGQSYPAVGRGFGGKDHTTVIWAVRRAEEMAAAEPEIARLLQDISAKARELAGIEPRGLAASPVRRPVRRPVAMAPKAPARVADATAGPAVWISDAQRREMRHLRAKGWSPRGLGKRYGITEEQVYAELGEKSPRQGAAR